MKKVKSRVITRKEAIKNISKYAALTALGTFMILLGLYKDYQEIEDM